MDERVKEISYLPTCTVLNDQVVEPFETKKAGCVGESCSFESSLLASTREIFLSTFQLDTIGPASEALVPWNGRVQD